MKVILLPKPRSRLKAALRRAGSREIGGVLMAEQIDVEQFKIVDFSVDAKTGGPAHFVRSPEHHAAALDDFFRRTGAAYSRFNYLGEWHSHPRFPVYPSAQDIQSMTSLVHGERGIDFAVLLIVRLNWFVLLECSATFHARGISPQQIEFRLE
jgi:integrative and conjugative element protein (TIGR02256 family)